MLEMGQFDPQHNRRLTCTSRFRHYCCGDLHHPLHSGVPHPLHVPPQGHLPHQWGQRRGVLGVGRHGHHWNWPQLHRDHRREQEGMVHLTGWGQNVQTLSDSIRTSRNLGSSFGVQAEMWIGLYILNSLSIFLSWLGVCRVLYIFNLWIMCEQSVSSSVQIFFYLLWIETFTFARFFFVYFFIYLIICSNFDCIAYLYLRVLSFRLLKQFLRV